MLVIYERFVFLEYGFLFEESNKFISPGDNLQKEENNDLSELWRIILLGYRFIRRMCIRQQLTFHHLYLQYA